MTNSDPNPSRFFQQLGKTEPEGSSAFLDAQQVHLRENKHCGFIEIQVSKTTQIILLFAQGVLAGTYLVEENNSKPFQIMNLSTIWDGKPTPIRTVELPQIVGRMVWLALESQIRDEVEIARRQDLEQRLNTWKSDRFSGTIEVVSEKTRGIFYVYEGKPLDSESFYYNGAEFINALAPQQIPDDAAKVIVHNLCTASQSQQCLMLRQGVLQWGSGILSRYQEMVGQKLIKMIQTDIEQIVQPWGWHVRIENSTFRDEHFFSYAQTAAQAYRAVLMEIGSQMNQVVGNALTLRILNETFDGINKDMRAALELHRLIPAAFSD